MIELRILGALDLRTADGASLDEALTRSKRIALLAYLTTARPLGFHRRDKLVTLFWPDLDKERARGALRTTLSRLRDDLGDDVIESRGAEEIGIRRDRIWCDAVALRERIGQGDVLDAAALYGGPMLDGVHISGTSDEFEQWLTAEREAIRRTLLTALSAEAEAHASRGQIAAAADCARRARDLAPADEVMARSLIRIMLSAGDRGGALDAYDVIESVLRREFNVQPSDETRALVQPLRDEPPPVPGAMGGVQRLPRGEIYSLVPARRPLRVAWIALAGVVVIASAFLARRLPQANASVAVSPWRTLTQIQGQFRGRVGVVAYMDSSGGLTVFGGALSPDPGQPVEVHGEMFRLSSIRDESRAGFTFVHPGGESPGRRWLAGMATDTVHDRAIMQGGATGSTSPCLNDTWVLGHVSRNPDALAWRRVSTRGELPPTRAGVSTVFDATQRRLVIFGGNDCFASYGNDVWILDFDDDSLASGQWSRVEPDGTAGSPAPRNTPATWLDASGRLFVLGGTVGHGPVSDLWMLDGLGGRHPAWHPLRCQGQAPTRTLHSAIYDDRTKSALVFGGLDGALTYRRELFRLTGLGGDAQACHWEEIPVVEPWPSARSRAQLMLDPHSHQLVLFGGEYQNTSFTDVWTIERPFGR